MRLRVLSDLHLEDNDIKSIPVYDANENDILTIVAGDLGGDLEKNCQYLTSNFSNCIFIGGNYICANPNNPRTIEQIREYYRQHFPVNNNITFLEKEYKIIDDYVFVGCTLWTDQNCVSDPALARKRYQLVKEYLQNDNSPTKLIRYRKHRKIKYVNQKYLLSEFKKSLKFLKKTLKKFANKKVIVIVHHCVSKKAIVEKYLNYRYSNMVISELDKFFTKFDNIKLIVHGHTHASVNYQLGNIKVYCNPLGRHNENPFFNKNLFIDV